MSRLKRMIRLITFALLGAAIYQEMSKDPAERTGEGSVGGVVPYDFRPPTVEKVKSSLWNPDDPRLFTPTVFGVGWTINFATLFALLKQANEAR